MLSAKDVMSPAVISVTPETSMNEAMEILLANRVSGLPVIDAAGRLVGVISEIDRLRTLNKPEPIENARVADFMTPGVITVDENATANQIADLLIRVGIRRLPVVRNGNVVGIISRRDLVRALHEKTDLAPTPTPPA